MYCSEIAWKFCFFMYWWLFFNFKLVNEYWRDKVDYCISMVDTADEVGNQHCSQYMTKRQAKKRLNSNIEQQKKLNEIPHGLLQSPITWFSHISYYDPLDVFVKNLETWSSIFSTISYIWWESRSYFTICQF